MKALELVVNIEAKLHQLSLQNTRTEMFWVMDLLNNLTVEEDFYGVIIFK
jgi:hypothetical protein